MGSLLGLPFDVLGFEEDVNESALLTGLFPAIADFVSDRLILYRRLSRKTAL